MAAKKGTTPDGTEEPSFEQALGRLEELVQQLERGELTLEQSLAAYEEGMRMARLCSGRLKQAEKRIQELTETPGGEGGLDLFSGEAGADEGV